MKYNFTITFQTRKEKNEFVDKAIALGVTSDIFPIDKLSYGMYSEASYKKLTK